MAATVYLMPLAGAGTQADPREPKYLSLFAGADFTCIPYGLEPVCLVAVENITVAANTAVVANADVTAVPANLNNNVGANLATVQAALDSLNIPNSWVGAGTTFGLVLKTTALVFLYLQRVHGLLPGTRLFNGATLATTIGSIPANVRSALNQAAISFGFDTSGVTAGTTLHVALKAAADQMPNIRITIGSVTL